MHLISAKPRKSPRKMNYFKTVQIHSEKESFECDFLNWMRKILELDVQVSLWKANSTASS
jgi:hypothetical protein